MNSDNLGEAIGLVDTLQSSMNEVNQGAEGALNKANDALIKNRLAVGSASDLTRRNQKVTGANVVFEGVKGQNEGLEDTLKKQMDVQNIVQATAAIGQLSFAWQSFQNLGSIWTNADLTTGEKVEQTIMNLSMTVPQLISSFIELKEASKLDFENLFSSIKTNEIAKMQTALDSMQLGSFANGLTATTIKFKAFGAGAKIASAGLQVFKALIEGLSSPLGMATIGIAAAGGALLNFLHQKNQAARDKQVETTGRQVQIKHRPLLQRKGRVLQRGSRQHIIRRRIRTYKRRNLIIEYEKASFYLHDSHTAGNGSQRTGTRREKQKSYQLLSARLGIQH